MRLTQDLKDGDDAVRETVEADICVIGAGSGGLSVAAGAAQLGISTVLFERGAMGGDCLNFGCVPSKALLAAGHAAAAARAAGRFGIALPEPAVDFAAVRGHVQGVVAAIAPHDSVERFEGLGVRVIRGHARFVSPREVVGEGVRVRARRFVVATGSAPLVPPIPGLDGVPYLTNETIFALGERPEHLLVIGGGPIGLELAEAYLGLGCRVTVIEAARVLGREDPDAAGLLRDHLMERGMAIEEGAKVTAAARDGARILLDIEDAAGRRRVEGSHLLVAVGRVPNLRDLGLEAAGIEYDRKGIRVDAGLRTSNRRVYAIGDVAGGPQFTHVAGYQAGVVIKSALFRLPAKADHGAVPRVTYTSLELAHVGLTEAEARDRHDRIEVLKWPFAENDRAQAERRTEGFVKVVATPRGRVLGATIVGAGAGELIQTWCLALAQGIKLSAIASLIVPYPTLSEASKRAASSFFTPRLFAERTRKLVRFLARFG